MRDSPQHGSRSADGREAVVLACTDCGQRWLVAGVDEGELYTCKSCGQSFVAAPVDVLVRAAPWRRRAPRARPRLRTA